MQQCAIESLPLLPNEISLTERGLSLAGYASVAIPSATGTAFFVNGLRFDTVEHPVSDPVVTERFRHADGIGCLVRATMTKELEAIRNARFWRFDASRSGAFVPARWRQAVHLMNPSFETFPIPPAHAMNRGVGTDDPMLFAMGGSTIFKNIESWLAEQGLHWPTFPNILDWGCGVGRVSRYLISETPGDITGVDIDPEAIAWCRANLPGARFETVDLEPPLPFDDATFDLAIGLSVVPHLSEPHQDMWLAEMHRVTRPGSLLFLSVRGRTQLAYSDTPGAVYERLLAGGFLDLSRDPALDDVIADPEYYRSVLHARDYIARRWTRWFDIVAFEDGIAALEDFVVLRRKP